MTEPRPGQETPTSTRAGTYVRQPGGFDAFVPSDFPPQDLELTPRLVGLLSLADPERGKLVGTAQILRTLTFSFSCMCAVKQSSRAK